MLPAEKDDQAGPSTELDLCAVDLGKIPKRVRRSRKKQEALPGESPTQKPKAQVDETEIPRGTRKPLLHLPWRSGEQSGLPRDKRLRSERKAKPRKNVHKTAFLGYTLGTPVRPVEQTTGKEGSLLLQALQVPPRSSTILHYTQGFHAYPGRVSPYLPQILLQKARKGSLLYDPFMGSGTILLEGLLAGMRVAGNDLNPIARLITQERCRWLSLRNARRVWTEVEELRQAIEAEKLGHRRVSHPHAEWLQSRYPPHLLVEMLHWLDRINRLQDPAIRESLRAVFSSLVYRFTSEEEARRKSRVGRGQFGRAMSERTLELIQAQSELSAKIRSRELPQLSCGNTLELQRETPLKVDLLISRPPFPGSSRFLRQKGLLLKWLGLPEKAMETKMLGTVQDCFKKNWTPRFRKMMLNLRRSMVPGGKCYLLIEDWLDRGKRVDALEFSRRFSGSEGWTLEAHASRKVYAPPQEKVAYGRTGKSEYLVLFRN